MPRPTIRWSSGRTRWWFFASPFHLKTPTSATRAFSFQVYDPTYFVAFEMEKDNPVNLAGAPKGCSINVLGSNPLAASDTKKLSELFFSGLSPGTDFGVKLASRIIVACP